MRMYNINTNKFLNSIKRDCCIVIFTEKLNRRFEENLFMGFIGIEKMEVDKGRFSNLAF